MSTNIQFLTDDSGKRTAVLVAIEEWEAMVQQLKMLLQQEELRQRLTAAFQDVRAAQAGEKELMTLNLFSKK
jgi:PHD/YefM family antitoxin component YafN of YafNO toxin-antitoxin module